MRAKKVDWLDRKNFADDYSNDETTPDATAVGGGGMCEWISVKDRLPEYKTPYDYVLVCDADGCGNAIAWRDSPYEGGKVWCFSSDLWVDEHVTHWMPLPELPEVQE